MTLGPGDIGVCPHADLVPREVAEQWLKHLREELPTVGFRCSTQKQGGRLGQQQLPRGAAARHEALRERKLQRRGRGQEAPPNNEPLLGGSACLGADPLMQLLKNYARNAGVKTAISVGERQSGLVL